MNIVTVKGQCPQCHNQVTFETEGLQPKIGVCPLCKVTIKFLELGLASFKDENAKILPSGIVTIEIYGGDWTNT
jgi:hypothetical protein